MEQSAREIENLKSDEVFFLNTFYSYSRYPDSAVQDIEDIREKYYQNAPNRFFIDSKFLLSGIPFSYLRVFVLATKGKETIIDPVVSEFVDGEGQLEKKNLRELILEQYIAHFTNKVMKRGLSLYFFGANSRGKTFNALHTAFMINIESVMKNKVLAHPFYYIRYSELMQIYTKMIFRPEENPSLQKFISRLMKVDLLIIDEIGKEIKTNAASLTNFELIIKERSAKDLPTIMIGNLRPRSPQPTRQSRGGLREALETTNMAEAEEHSLRSIFGESVYASMMKQYRFLEFTTDNKDMRKEDNAKIWKL